MGGDGRLRVEAYLDGGDKDATKRLFDELASIPEKYEFRVGLPLAWERLDDKRASRTAAYHPAFSFDDAGARETARMWAVRATLAMYDVLDEALRRRAREIREEARRQDQGSG